MIDLIGDKWKDTSEILDELGWRNVQGPTSKRRSRRGRDFASRCSKLIFMSLQRLWFVGWFILGDDQRSDDNDWWILHVRSENWWS